MKNMKLFISLVLAVVICVVMAGCASRPTQGEGWNDPNKPDEQEWSDPNSPDNQDWSDPDGYGNQDWSDPENYDDQDWRDPENPGTEPADPGESDHTGMYRHEVDGVVFYTEHDLEQWIVRRDERFYPQFDLAQMTRDIFGDDQTDSWDGTAIFPYGSTVSSLEFNNADMSGSTSLQAKSGVYPFILTGRTVVYDMGYGDGSEYYKPYYFINGSYHCTDYELMEIALYAFERWSHGESYLFENFLNSTRIMVVSR